MTSESAAVTPHTPPVWGRIPYGLLLWSGCLVIWATWGPFYVRGFVPRVALTFPGNILDVIGNVLLCTPVAILVAATLRTSGRRHCLLITALAAGTISLVAETGQLLLVERTASPYDMLLNTAGAVLFAAATLRLLDRGWARTRVVAGTAALTLVVLGSFLTLEGVRVTRGMRVAGWDPRYRVVVGDEADSSRPYEGLIDKARICAGAEPERICLRAGATRDERSSFVETAQRSQRVTAYATVRSASDSQWGPTRIITFSINPRRRNITLAQEGTSLAFRIRTPVTGPNGSDPQFWLPHVIPASQRTELTATFDHGLVTLRASSSEGTSEAHYAFGLLNSWLTRLPNRILEPPHLTRARPATALILFLGLGLVLGSALRRRSIFTVGSIAVALAATLCVGDSLLGARYGIDGLALATGLAAAGAALSIVDRRALRSVKESPPDPEAARARRPS